MDNLSSKIFKLGEHLYRVEQFSNIDKLQLGNAYTFGGENCNYAIRYNYVLPFVGKYTKKSDKPGVYINDEDKLRIVHPKTDRDRKLYSIERIFVLGPDTVRDELSKYLNEIDDVYLKYTGKVFEPKIKPSDDMSMKAIRLALLKKQIDFNAYSNRFSMPHAKSNAKKALMFDDSLTGTKLKEYADVFDLAIGLIIFDRRGARDPLYPDGRRAMVVFDDEEFVINDPNIDIISSVEDVLPKEDVE